MVAIITMNTTKIVLAIAVTSVMVAVALAPMMLSQALATKQQTCTNGGGQDKPCDSPPAKIETCTAGSKGQTNANCP